MTDNEKIFDAFAATCKERDFPAVLILQDGKRYFSIMHGSLPTVQQLLNNLVFYHARQLNLKPYDLLIHMAIVQARFEVNRKTAKSKRKKSDPFTLLSELLAKHLKTVEKLWRNPQ